VTLEDYMRIEQQARKLIFSWLEWADARGWDNEEFSVFLDDLKELARLVNVPIPTDEKESENGKTVP